jgi:hypothetical protein
VRNGKEVTYFLHTSRQQKKRGRQRDAWDNEQGELKKREGGRAGERAGGREGGREGGVFFSPVTTRGVLTRRIPRRTCTPKIIGSFALKMWSGMILRMTGKTAVAMAWREGGREGGREEGRTLGRPVVLEGKRKEEGTQSRKRETVGGARRRGGRSGKEGGREGGRAGGREGEREGGAGLPPSPSSLPRTF